MQRINTSRAVARMKYMQMFRIKTKKYDPGNSICSPQPVIYTYSAIPIFVFRVNPWPAFAKRFHYDARREALDSA